MCFKNDARVIEDPNTTPPLGMRTPRGFRMPLWPEDRDRRFALVKAPINRVAAALGFAMGPFDLADHEPSCRYRRTVYAVRNGARFVGRAARTFAVGWTP